MASETDEVLNPTQAAAMLQVRRGRLESLVRHGDLTVVQRRTETKNVRPFFKRAEVVALATSQTWQKRRRS